MHPGTFHQNENEPDTAAELVGRSPPYTGGILKIFGVEEGRAAGRASFRISASQKKTTW